MQVHLKEKQVFAQMPQAQYTENASARQKKKKIAASSSTYRYSSTSVYMEMVDNQLPLTHLLDLTVQSSPRNSFFHCLYFPKWLPLSTLTMMRSEPHTGS